MPLVSRAAFQTLLSSNVSISLRMLRSTTDHRTRQHLFARGNVVAHHLHLHPALAWSNIEVVIISKHSGCRPIRTNETKKETWVALCNTVMTNNQAQTSAHFFGHGWCKRPVVTSCSVLMLLQHMACNAEVYLFICIITDYEEKVESRQ